MRILADRLAKQGIAIGKFNQREIFREAKKLQTETILTPEEYKEFVKRQFQTNVHPVFFRSRHYCVYRRGFETGHGMPVDREILLVTNGITEKFEIPDIVHPNDRNVGLRGSTGVLIFNIDKLVYDETAHTVCVDPSTFDPRADVFVIDKLANGIGTLNMQSYPINDPKATFFSMGMGIAKIVAGNKFEAGSTGHHGSVGVFVDTFYHRWTLNLSAGWDAQSAIVVKMIGEAVNTP
jgi:hypothetical protein